jgi:hypothetical protein
MGWKKRKYGPKVSSGDNWVTIVAGQRRLSHLLRASRVITIEWTGAGDAILCGVGAQLVDPRFGDERRAKPICR